MKFIRIILLFISLTSFGQNKISYADTLIISLAGDTALTTTGPLSFRGKPEIHFNLIYKNNNKEINFINEAKELVPYREKSSLISLIPSDIIEKYHLKYYAIRLPNDTLANDDIAIKTEILKKKIGAIDKTHNDTVYYCKIRQEIFHKGNLLFKTTYTTALMYKSIERHFGIKLYKWYCPQNKKYIIRFDNVETKYDAKTDRYKGEGHSRLLFT